MTRTVKRTHVRLQRSTRELQPCECQKRDSSPFVLAACAAALGGACKKESKQAGDRHHRAHRARTTRRSPTDNTPIAGDRRRQLAARSSRRFYTLVDSLSRRAARPTAFAPRTHDDRPQAGAVRDPYLATMVADDFPEKNIREFWDAKYKDADRR